MSDDKLKSEDEKPTSRKSRQPTTRKTAAKKSSAKAKPEEKSTSTTPKKTVAKKTTTKKAVSKASASSDTSSSEKTESSPKKTGPVAKTVTATSKRVTDKNKSEPVGEGANKPAPKAPGTTPNPSEKPQGKSTDKNVEAAKPKKGSTEVKDKTKSLSAESKDAIARPKKGYSLAKMITVAAVLFLGVLAVFLIGNESIMPVDDTSSQATATQATDEPNPNASSPYGMRVEQLKEIEGLLASLNFDPGRIDGDIDHEAVAAISLFQEISGLQVDGKPTQELLAELKAVDKMLSNN